MVDAKWSSDNESPIPTINLPDATDTMSGYWSIQVSNMYRACQEFGCFYVTSPSMTVDYLSGIESLANSYFSAPLEEKMTLHISKSPNHRGYFPVGEENAKGSEIKDTKEGFDLALHLDLHDPDVVAGKPLHGPNVYPACPPDFRPKIDDFYGRLRETADTLCQMLAEALGLPSDHFKPMVSKPLAQLRILRYPVAEAIGSHVVVGAGEHTDYGIITLLWQDGTGGLEVRTPQGHLREVPPREGQIFCLLGEITQRITNGLWRATPHLVVGSSRKDRYSAAFFFDPNYDAVISAPAELLKGEAPIYPPITMGEYLKTSFDETFTYRSE